MGDDEKVIGIVAAIVFAGLLVTDEIASSQGLPSRKESELLDTAIGYANRILQNTDIGGGHP